MDSTEQKKTKKDKTRLIIAGILIFIGAGLWIWDDYIKDRVIPKRFGVVEQNLIYRSGEIHRALIEKVLKKHDIDVIINLTNYDKANPNSVAEKEISERLGIKTCRYPLRGNGTGAVENYAGALKDLVTESRKGNKVLLHCAAGSQRSGGLTAFYRLLVQEKDPDEVIKEMKKYDWDTDDTDLLNYINENIGAVASIMVQHGIIEKVPEPLPQLNP